LYNNTDNTISRHFKAIFQVIFWLSGFPFGSQSPVVLILSVHTGRMETLHTLVFEVGGCGCLC